MMALRPRYVVGKYRYPFSHPGGVMEKSRWAKPVLVSKPVSETAQGAGSNADGIGGEFPIPGS